MGERPRVKVGDAAPDFTLLNAQGRPVRLADHLGRGCVVIFF